MAYADPQSITYNAVAQSLNRTGSGINQGSFFVAGTGGATFGLDISHSYGSARTRRVSKLSVGQVNANPYATGLSAYEQTFCYLVVDTPAKNGVVDPAVAVLSVNALTKWFTDNTNANALKLVQGQN